MISKVNNLSMKIKILLLVISTVLSLVLAEVIIWVYLKNVNSEKIYHDISEYELYQKEEERNTNYMRDKSFEVFKGKEKLEILCIGDSFTNAGNTFFDNSYPAQLYEMLDKKITVRNLGVCSSTTKQVRERLENFFEGKSYDPMKRYVIVVLAGAADIFSANLSYPHIVNLPKLQSDFVIEREMNQKSLSSSKNFYIISIFKYVWSKFTNNLNFDGRHTWNSYLFNHELNKCESLVNSDNKIQCALVVSNSFSIQDIRQDIKEHLVIRWLFGSRINNPKLISDVINDFISLFKKAPFFLERDYLVMNILGLMSAQDKVSFEEFRSVVFSQSKFLAPKTARYNQEMIENYFNYTKKNSNLGTIRDQEWSRISEISKKNNARLLVLNYPVSYRSTNPYLMSMSKKYKLEFLDIEKKFQNQEGLIDDWEHCSKEGYTVIARTVAEKIINP